MDKLEIRMGLIVLTPFLFIAGGIKAVYDIYREFWKCEQ
jgi:hypothetical protein